MTCAGVLLALAVLTGPRPLAVRRRAGLRYAGRAPTPPPYRPDPLAAASALDVFAVCLAAGMPVSTAARASAPGAPPPLADMLCRAADLLALGADPAVAWSAPRCDADEQCLGLLRLARRSAVSGTSMADAVAELAVESRRQVSHRAAAAAERASVVIAGPLGLCFLPAFICLGLIPVVAGLASDVFTSGLL